MTSPVESIRIQTRSSPLEGLPRVKDHIEALARLEEWTGVGILYDDELSGVLFLFLRENEVVGVMRFWMSVEDVTSAIEFARRGSAEIRLACWQGNRFASRQVVDLGELTRIWTLSRDQSNTVSLEQAAEFFGRIDSGELLKGRGEKFDAETRRQVWFDGHGRCMFEGCGVDLTVDAVTGLNGNFADLSHNVASSERGPRGILYLSNLLSNTPENVLLLCHTHHRVIDVVARTDYSSERLSNMRRRFCDDAGQLLNGLSKPAIPAYCISWPVHSQVISAPSAHDITRSLAPIGARLDGALHSLTDNESTLRLMSTSNVWNFMPTIVDGTADRLLSQVHLSSYRAALFAMGLMPALIALGAKIGNKCEVTPMLRHRETGLWYWPEEEPQGEFYDIEGLDSLTDAESEVVVRLSLTNDAPAMQATSEKLGFKVIGIVAKSGLMGNGALAHPHDGYVFRHQMQELLHLLKDRHGVKRVHLLPCASNAACVFFGQAFDNHHPDMRIYDFAGELMEARLELRSSEDRCVVSCA